MTPRSPLRYGRCSVLLCREPCAAVGQQEKPAETVLLAGAWQLLAGNPDGSVDAVGVVWAEMTRASTTVRLAGAGGAALAQRRVPRKSMTGRGSGRGAGTGKLAVGAARGRVVAWRTEDLSKWQQGQ
jgi:hypothetical protein